MLHDSARFHITNMVRQNIQQKKWSILEYPLYSPDLLPCDFYIFGKPKKELKDRHFVSNSKVQNAVKEFFNQ